MSTSQNSGSPAMIIRIHRSNGSVESFSQADEATARKTWEAIDPVRLFAQQEFLTRWAQISAGQVSCAHAGGLRRARARQL